MATKVQNLGLYGDVKAVLDAALVQGGARYTFPIDEAMGMTAEKANKKALGWRYRANYYRTLLYREALKTAVPGQTVFTPYDMLIFRVPPGANYVIIEMRKIMGQIETLEGEPLPEAEAPPKMFKKGIF